LFADNEREMVARDKLDKVKEEIEGYRTNRNKNLNNADLTESIENAIYSEESYNKKVWKNKRRILSSANEKF
jgi:hypothetical protein